MLGDVEGLVVKELEVGRKAQIDRMAQKAPQMATGAIEAGDDFGGVRPAQGFDEGDRVLEVGAHSDLADGHRHAGEGRIDEILLTQDVNESMAHQLAGAELALRRTNRGAAILLAMAGHDFEVAQVSAAGVSDPAAAEGQGF